MKKNINIVTGKMIREDTRIVFQKLNEMKTDWKTALDTLFSNDAVDYAVKSYSDYSKKAVADAGKTTEPDAGKTTELPKIDVAGQKIGRAHV